MRAVNVGVAVLFMIGHCALLAFGSDKETQVKAAYLLNFAKMIEWPASAFERHPETFYICVPFGDPLAEVTSAQQGKTVKGKKVEWLGIAGFDKASDCQVMFIPDRRRLSQAIRATGTHPVLFVGEQDGFCQSGGGINLVPVDGRIAFEVNLKALQRGDLKAGAQLLKVAREVFH
jgi:hypothetical protein